MLANKKIKVVRKSNSAVDHEKLSAKKNLMAQETSRLVREKTVRKSRLSTTRKLHKSVGGLDLLDKGISDTNTTRDGSLRRFSDRSVRKNKLKRSLKRNHSDGSLDFSDTDNANDAILRRSSDKAERKSSSHQPNHSDGSLDFSNADISVVGPEKQKHRDSRRSCLSMSRHQHQSERSLCLSDLDGAGSNHSSRRPRTRVSLQSYLDHHSRPSAPEAVAMDIIAVVEASKEFIHTEEKTECEVDLSRRLESFRPYCTIVQ